ncbi:presenilin-like protein At1g08700 [Silene latifolia]|uniref:presenilin-like protein At1g08700 n=1 Tax=Silene latifolia TaxID=37657 RepID=UPI003D78228B
MEESILEFIGSELIGVISPVSICMFLVVLLVSSLSPSSTSSSSSSPSSDLVSVANLVYAETPTDSTATKLTGAVENAVVFIFFIAVVTFVLVILYYYNFTNFLKYYMRFSTFFILLSLGGAIILSIIRHFSIDVDFASFAVFMLNFSAVGVVAVFGGGGVPIVVTQGYTVALGIITAAWFTQLPEWTTWVLLVALAVYDLVAVLAPGGPLKILVELAQSRDDDLPALVYEARPRVRVSRGGGGRGGGGAIVGLETVVVSENVGVEMRSLGGNDGTREREGERVGLVSNLESSSEIGVVDEERPMVRDRGSGVLGVSDNVVVEMRNLSANDGNVGLVSNLGSSSETSVADEERSRLMEGRGSGEEDDDDSEMTVRGIKLGLGDFVFYSVLVGRAAMYDLMTVYACYLAIISGLACTLILLSVARRALPALPISIALGIAFYFLTRLLMEPFVVHTSTNLLMF